MSTCPDCGNTRYIFTGVEECQDCKRGWPFQPIGEPRPWEPREITQMRRLRTSWARHRKPEPDHMWLYLA